MIYKFTRHTALEILKELVTNPLGFPVGEEFFLPENACGKVRVRIGGLRIANSEQMIRVLGEDSLEVIVGATLYQVSVTDSDPTVPVLTEHAKEVLAKKGLAATEASEKLQRVKTVLIALIEDKAYVKEDEDIEAEAKKQYEFYLISEDKKNKDEAERLASKSKRK